MDRLGSPEPELVAGAATTDGASVVQSSDGDVANQLWKVVSVD
ncbi:hypothetical protein ABZ490_35620 [Streptomyces sp. NPDC005811]